MNLRPYQQEARQSIQDQWQSGVRRTLLVLPTGCGKTIVFSKVTEDRVTLGERVLVLAHRGELLDQAADKLKKCDGEGGADVNRQLVPRRRGQCADPHER